MWRGVFVAMFNDITMIDIIVADIIVVDIFVSDSVSRR